MCLQSRTICPPREGNTMTSTSPDDQDIVGFDTDEGPYSFYSRIREEQPVFWSERLQRWILTRYDDVFAAYRNTQVFSSQTFASRGAGTQLGDSAQDRVVDTFTKQILFLDRPEHTRLRRLVSYAFTPRSVEAIRGYAASLTKSMLDDLRDDEFDFVRSFAGPLPLLVVSEIFGVDVGDRDLYRAWSDSLAFITSPNQPAEELRTAFQHVDEMRAYLVDLVEARRKALADDLLSRMIEVNDGGDRLTTDEIVAMAMIITAAGHETTTSLLVNTLRLLLNDPERASRLGAEDVFRKSAIEETLRWEPPLQFNTRVATEDFELHGTVIPAGAAVALAPAGANRDPRKFAQAEQFDPERSPNSHLTFGNGAHACLGANLARLEADVVVGMIARDYPTLRAGSSIVRKRSPLFRGFESVTAVWS
jgi:cytochrome P450